MGRARVRCRDRIPWFAVGSINERKRGSWSPYWAVACITACRGRAISSGRIEYGEYMIWALAWRIVDRVVLKIGICCPSSSAIVTPQGRSAEVDLDSISSRVRILS